MSANDDADTTAPPERPRSFDRWFKFGAILLAMVVAVVGAFAVGRITANNDDTGLADSTSTTAPPVTSSTTTSTLPTTTTTTLSLTTEHVERIAEVAAIAAPSVVHLETRYASGSGVIFDDEGHILTAAHVLEDVTDVTVRLHDGRTLEGEVIGLDEDTDVAVIQVDPSLDLPVAQLALEAELEVGQLAVAVGSPFGLEHSVTAGIVSAVDRVVEGVLMVQTDAAINPGNSGGPLVDAEGRVIGINDQMFSRSGIFEGVGFAINIDLAVKVAEQLIAGEEVQLASLGVSVSASVGTSTGARVDQVEPGSAADGAGIQVGDLIISFDGDPITNGAQLRAAILDRDPGDRVDVIVLRDEEELTLTVWLDSAGD
jgi:S1-C subfamily serine protease